MRARTIKNLIVSFATVTIAMTALVLSQGFDLINAKPSDKVASGSLFTITNNGIEQYHATSITQPYAILTTETLYVANEQKTTSVSDGGSIVKTSSLQQNYPNPFNNSTVIRFSVNEASTVTIAVYDLTGREVSTLVNGEKRSGIFSVGFSNTDIASGTYIYRMIAKNNSGKTTVETKKMIVMK